MVFLGKSSPTPRFQQLCADFWRSPTVGFFGFSTSPTRGGAKNRSPSTTYSRSSSGWVKLYRSYNLTHHPSPHLTHSSPTPQKYSFGVLSPVVRPPQRFSSTPCTLGGTFALYLSSNPFSSTLHMSSLRVLEVLLHVATTTSHTVAFREHASHPPGGPLGGVAPSSTPSQFSLAVGV